jgi:hypothetical protein
VCGPVWIEIHWSSIWLRIQSGMVLNYTWGPLTTRHDLGGVLWRLLNTFSFGLSEFHGHRSWLVCEVTLTAPPLIGRRTSSNCKPPNQVNSGPNLGGLGPAEGIVYLFRKI